MIAGMDRRLSAVIGSLTHRLRDFPPEAFEDLFRALEAIERKYDLLEPLREEDRIAIEKGLAQVERGEVIAWEDTKMYKRLQGYDRDKAGRENFADAVSRAQKLSGEEQRDIGDVIFALLNEYRWDFPPPPKER
jgi:hypothetical protein